MGDIIYTTPVIRCIKEQLKNAELHYLTKSGFKFLLDVNPYIDKLHLLKENLSETIADLKKEQFDYVIDLHNSLRSAIVKTLLGVQSSTFKKERIKKWIAINFKINMVKPVHLVDRYLETVRFLGIKNDQKPIDYYLTGDYNKEALLPPSHQKEHVVFIIGAAHFTKRLPNDKVITICKMINKPVVLLGGQDVEANGAFIKNAVGDRIYNACGKLNLNGSVFLVKTASKVIGFDTGLTHIAEAFNKEIVSIWGSTIPELLGVQPYHVSNYYEAGVDIHCRPCSKFGLDKCPRGHFKCMNDIDESKIADFINA
jgi:ADP-heptose:LPS heptosyltransferase